MLKVLSLALTITHYVVSTPYSCWLTNSLSSTRQLVPLITAISSHCSFQSGWCIRIVADHPIHWCRKIRTSCCSSIRNRGDHIRGSVYCLASYQYILVLSHSKNYYSDIVCCSLLWVGNRHHMCDWLQKLPLGVYHCTRWFHWQEEEGTDTQLHAHQCM